jgi:GNAT superfamily N-acetyltransferase
MKKIRVREAKPRDRGLFKKLWKLYLEEEHERGGVVLPTDENVEVAATLFDRYLGEDFDGVVLFVADKAVLMYGDAGMFYKTSLGKVATPWGIYVDPEVRNLSVATELTKAAVEKLTALGFDHLFGDVLLGNEASIKAIEHVVPTKDYSMIKIAELKNGEK